MSDIVLQNMRLKKIIFYIGVCSAYSCGSLNSNSETKTEDSISSEAIKITDRKSASYYDSLLAKTDEKCLNAKIDSVKLSKIYSDTVDLILFHNDVHPIKLVYSILDEGGVRDGYGEYFFDQSGKLIGNRVNNFYEIFNDYDSLILFEKEKEKLKINRIDKAGKLSKLAIASRETASFLQFFPKVKYINVWASEVSMPTLRANSIGVELKEKPTIKSSTIKKLEKAHLVYLGSTIKQDTVGNKIWIWYKVLTENKIKGWVFGHPTYVSDLNDENFSD